MFLASLIPGAMLYLFGATEYQKFSLMLLGFGASVGLSYCALAYRKSAGVQG